MTGFSFLIVVRFWRKSTTCRQRAILFVCRSSHLDRILHTCRLFPQVPRQFRHRHPFLLREGFDPLLLIFGDCDPDRYLFSVHYFVFLRRLLQRSSASSGTAIATRSGRLNRYVFSSSLPIYLRAIPGFTDQQKFPLIPSLENRY